MRSPSGGKSLTTGRRWPRRRQSPRTPAPLVAAIQRRQLVEQVGHPWRRPGRTRTVGGQRRRQQSAGLLQARRDDTHGGAAGRTRAGHRRPETHHGRHASGGHFPWVPQKSSSDVPTPPRVCGARDSVPELCQVQTNWICCNCQILHLTVWPPGCKGPTPDEEISRPRPGRHRVACGTVR